MSQDTPRTGTRRDPPGGNAADRLRQAGLAGLNLVKKVRFSLITKLALTSGTSLMLFFFLWSSLNISAMKKMAMENTMADIDRLGSTIALGLHYAMLTYSPANIREIIKNISTQEAINSIRVYNKQGQIKYSNLLAEIDGHTDIKEEACYVCHRTEPPLKDLSLRNRTRFFTDAEGEKCIGILSPIRNEPACSSDPCHVHPADKQILGLLDMVVSLEGSEATIGRYSELNFFMALGIALATFLILFLFMHLLVNRPVRKMIRATRDIAEGKGFGGMDVAQADEMGELARAIDSMGREVIKKQTELERQTNLYRDLFQHVPCLITVQDTNLRLLSYNRIFAEKFNARLGEYCYKAYKGRNEPCPSCPVIRTFEDGLSHTNEEITLGKDGQPRTVLVRTSPMTEENGHITSVMEISLDITERKRLEEELEISRKKYLAIFSNIPFSVFVVDQETLRILECNARPRDIYGFEIEEMIGMSFLDLFADSEKAKYERLIREETILDRVRHRTKAGKDFYVAMRVSTSDYPGKKVFLVSVTDITKRLETEQQLIQASKMATLGEMATSVAHELNQPLTVIQTIAEFLRRKIGRNEPIGQAIYLEMAEGIGKHIERATKIINHMREFGRKSELRLTPVNLADVLRHTLELFSQQFKVRNIEVALDAPENLPPVLAEPNRLEQVFMNLLVNARDAIAERFEHEAGPGDKRIEIALVPRDGHVAVTIADTGVGIPADILDKIFEPFFTTKEVGKGTGLGLSISYGIIKDYGGTIRAESRPGGGARFVITMPVKAA